MPNLVVIIPATLKMTNDHVEPGRKNIVPNVYRPRNPQNSDYFQCVQDNFEELQSVWDDRFASRYGYWRPYVMDVIYRYLRVRRFALRLCKGLLRSLWS